MPITAVASIDLELLGNLIGMEKISADSINDLTDERALELL
jgi:hypothetical protein